MISSLHLQHFKCFADLRLPLAPLTLLTGVNAGGKSSAIQPLVLLHQTMRENELAKSLMLNGPLLRLGRFGDVVDELHGRDSFAIGVSAGGVSVRWLFHSESKDALAAPVSERTVTAGQSLVPTSDWSAASFFPRPSSPQGSWAGTLNEIEHWLTGLLYLSTERIGPRETYRADTGFTDRVELGSGGELTPWFLHQQRDRQVHPSLCLDATTTLARQVEARLADFFPGAGVDLKPVEGTNLVTLLIRTTAAGPGSRFHSAWRSRCSPPLERPWRPPWDRPPSSPRGLAG